MNPPQEDSLPTRREKALQRYQDEIEWYERVKTRQRRLHYLLQVSIIVFSGLTPLLILIDGTPKVLQALPAAVAGMLTALNATFRAHENYARFAFVLEALKSEKFKFETRSTQDYGVNVDEQAALERLVGRMEELLINEVTDWRQVVTKKEEKTN